MSARFYALCVLALLGAAPCCINRGHAQPPPVDDATLLDLVRITAHESGLDSPGDVAGIWAVWVNGGAREHMSPRAFGHAYSHRFFAAPRGINAWTAAIDLDCSRPRGFALRWDLARPSEQISRRDACTVLVAAAREAISHPPICDATDWGNAADHARARALGRHFVMVQCGELPTANLWSRRARRSR